MSDPKQTACDAAWQEWIDQQGMDYSHHVTAHRAWYAAWERSTRHADDWACLRTDPDQYPLQHAAPTMAMAVEDLKTLTALIAGGY